MPLLYVYKVLIKVVLNKFVIKYTIILYDKHHWDRDDKINTNYYFSAYTYVCECVTQSVKCKISVIFDTIYTLYTYLYIIYMCVYIRTVIQYILYIFTIYLCIYIYIYIEGSLPAITAFPFCPLNAPLVIKILL